MNRLQSYFAAGFVFKSNFLLSRHILRLFSLFLVRRKKYIHEKKPVVPVVPLVILLRMR